MGLIPDNAMQVDDVSMRLMDTSTKDPGGVFADYSSTV